MQLLMICANIGAIFWARSLTSLVMKQFIPVDLYGEITSIYFLSFSAVAWSMFVKASATGGRLLSSSV